LITASISIGFGGRPAERRRTKNGPQDRINLPELGKTFRELLEKPVRDGGYGKSMSIFAKDTWWN